MKRKETKWRFKLFFDYDASLYVDREYFFNEKSYYEYIKKNKKKGLQQFPLTSKMIIDLMIELSNEFKLTDNWISFMQDDEYFNSELYNYKNSIYDLSKKLEVLYDNKSIEIKYIELESSDSVLNIKNNGIITISAPKKEDCNNLMEKILGIMNNWKK